jgi:hypothetical protein
MREDDDLFSSSSADEGSNPLKGAGLKNEVAGKAGPNEVSVAPQILETMSKQLNKLGGKLTEQASLLGKVDTNVSKLVEFAGQRPYDVNEAALQVVEMLLEMGHLQKVCMSNQKGQKPTGVIVTDMIQLMTQSDSDALAKAAKSGGDKLGETQVFSVGGKFNSADRQRLGRACTAAVEQVNKNFAEWENLKPESGTMQQITSGKVSNFKVYTITVVDASTGRSYCELCETMDKSTVGTRLPGTDECACDKCLGTMVKNKFLAITQNADDQHSIQPMNAGSPLLAAKAMCKQGVGALTLEEYGEKILESGLRSPMRQQEIDISTTEIVEILKSDRVLRMAFAHRIVNSDVPADTFWAEVKNATDYGADPESYTIFDDWRRAMQDIVRMGSDIETKSSEIEGLKFCFYYCSLLMGSASYDSFEENKHEQPESQEVAGRSEKKGEGEAPGS